MKNIVYLVAVSLFFVGCSYKNESINLSSYNFNYSGEISQDNKAVYIESITDTRVDKRGVGYTLKDEVKDIKLYSNVDFVKKYQEGLESALYTSGFNINKAKNKEALKLKIYIKKIELLYSDKNFDENLKGEIELEVIIVKGDELIKKSIKQKAGKWISPSYSSKDMEPLLYELFSDSINNIVQTLVKQ